MFYQVCLESSSQFSNTDTGKNQIFCLKAQVSINKDGKRLVFFFHIYEKSDRIIDHQIVGILRI